MYRATPKLVMLLLIGGVVAAIFWKMHGAGAGPQHSSDVVYVNPNVTLAPAAPAPAQ